MKLTRFPGRDWVVIILAISILLIVVSAGVSIVYATVVNEKRSITNTAADILTPLFGGILAILGAYVGAGSNDNGKDKKGEGDKDET